MRDQDPDDNCVFVEDTQDRAAWMAAISKLQDLEAEA